MRNSKVKKYGTGTGVDGVILDANLLTDGPGDTIRPQKTNVLTPAQQAYLLRHEANKLKIAENLKNSSAEKFRQKWVTANPGKTTEDYWKWQKQRNKGADAGLDGMIKYGESESKGSCSPGVNEKKASASTSRINYALGTGEEGVEGPGDPIIDPLTGLPITGTINNTAHFNTKKIVRYQPGVSNEKHGDGFYLYAKNVGDAGFDVKRDREFIKNSAMADVQRTPEWLDYMKTQKFANGTGASGVTATNYLQDPKQALAENDIMVAKAEADAADNPWAMGVQMAGQIGSAMAKSFGGPKGESDPLAELGLVPEAELGEVPGFAAMGMKNASGQIEAEGGEVVETPGGEPAELQGPKHTSGGIDMEVPHGTKIYSDQLKGADGKTMADRKKSREKKMAKLDDLLATNKGDKAISNSHGRIKMAMDAEEAQDLQMQEMATQFTQMQEFAMGTGSQGVKMDGGTGPSGYRPKTFLNNFGENLTDYTYDTPNPLASNVVEASALDLGTEEGNTDVSEGGLSFTAGDATSLLGNAVSMFAPLNNSLKNRATDTVNKSPFENYGKDALATLDQEGSLLASQHDNDAQRVVKASNGAKRQSRNGASSINTMRATDLAVDLQSNDANANLSDQYAKQMMALMGQKGSLQTNIDQVKMGGRGAADLANRQDKDTFYTQLGKDKTAIGEGLQQTGKDLNQLASNETMMNMVNQMSKYFKFDKNNKIIAVNKKTK